MTWADFPVVYIPQFHGNVSVVLEFAIYGLPVAMLALGIAICLNK